MEQTEARAFAEQWVKDWNAHDVDALLAHFTDDVVFTSPVAIRVLGGDGVIRGKEALRRYWSEGIRLIPDLRFEVLAVYVGISTLVINYRNQAGGVVSEVLTFDGTLVREGHGTYLTQVLRAVGAWVRAGGEPRSSAVRGERHPVAGRGPETGHPAHVDQDAAAGDQQGQERAGAEVRARPVDAESAFPLLAGVPDEAAAVGDAHIADDQVDVIAGVLLKADSQDLTFEGPSSARAACRAGLVETLYAEPPPRASSWREGTADTDTRLRSSVPDE